MANHLNVPGLFPPPDYAHVALLQPSERLVFTAGAVPLDPGGALLGAGDFIAQTKQVLNNLEPIRSYIAVQLRVSVWTKNLLTFSLYSVPFRA